MLVALFAGSQFLTEILLNHPEYFERLARRRRLSQPKSAEEVHAAAWRAIAPWLDDPDRLRAAPALDALRRLQRWELLRIGACDLLDLFDMTTATEQLSNLAEGLVRASLEYAARRSGVSAEGFVVLAMGKLGGRELNYSSDIDLVFLAAANAERQVRLGQRLVEALARTTPEGFLYRVDLRLRPWGETGPLVASLEAATTYVREYARLWEKQALLKARVVAGDRPAGESFLRRVEILLFPSDGVSARDEVRAMRRRTEAYLVDQGREWGEVKLGTGSIRDVEFVVQYLQLAHGAAQPGILCHNTLDALARLAAAGLLASEESRVLVEGYTFLRTVEHHLQLMDYRQLHWLPREPGALAELGQRLGFQGAQAGELLVARYEEHSAAIRAVYRKYLEPEGRPLSPARHTPETRRHVARLAASYVEAFTDTEIEQHAELAGRLSQSNLVEVEAAPSGDGTWQVTIVAYDYLGELSVICGLLAVYGLNIQAGRVFTYEPAEAGQDGPAASPHPQAAGTGRLHPIGAQPWRSRRSRLRPPAAPGAAAGDAGRRKIVDVFTVIPSAGPATPGLWARYAGDLAALLQLLQRGRREEAQVLLAKRFALALPREREASGPAALFPIEIEIDNAASDRYTVLAIDTPDTPGFLYEFTNALALHGIYISEVEVETEGSRVQDRLYVTDASGRKVTTAEQQRQLRAATVLVKHFTHLLPRSPNPEAALSNFRQFLAHLFTRPDWPDQLATLERPTVLDALARLLGVSDFLWEDFLRMQHDNLFGVVRDVDALAAAKSKSQMQAELEAALAQPGSGRDWRDALNLFKDREMFRIDMRNIQGHITEFGQFSGELSDLAEVVVEAAYARCAAELERTYSTPRASDGAPCPLAVFALGKLGGRELGFASDIELMFVYGGPGATTGPEVISAADYYERLVRDFVSAIRARREGIFEVDLQLRPYGSAGRLAVALKAFEQYFAPDGPAWAYERQALVRLRPLAGDPTFGGQVVALRDQFVYSGRPFDVAAMRAMRERQLRHLVTGGTLNVKFSPGGLVDVEYLVQALQITHGREKPALRSPSTRRAMAALRDVGLLSPADYERLRDGHNFLRQVINALRMVRGNAKDMTVPPTDGEEFDYLARRLGYQGDVQRLQDDLVRHTTAVREINTRLLRAAAAADKP